MSTSIGIIKRFVEFLTNADVSGGEEGKAVDTALQQFRIDGSAALISQYREDISMSSSYDNFYKQYCGINRNNSDIGAITGSDAGGSTTKTLESIIPESSVAVELTNAEYNSFTKNGLTVNITYDEPDTIGSAFDFDVSNYIDKQKLVVKNLYNWWIPEALDLIDESLGINFYDGRTDARMDLIFSYDTTDTNLLYWTQRTSGDTNRFNLTINMRYFTNLTSNDKNGTLDSGDYFDVTFLESLTKMVLNANIKNYNYYNGMGGGYYSYIAQGLWKIVRGYDDQMSYSPDQETYAQLRYLAKQYSDGDPSDIIYVHNKNTLTGNSGDDTFIVTSNTTVATLNGNGGTDTISFQEGQLSDMSASLSGNDVILSSNNAAILLKDMKGKSFSIVDSSNNNLLTLVGSAEVDGIKYNSDKTAVTLTSDYNSNILFDDDYASTVKKIDASSLTSDIWIFGNNNSNLIVGGKGNDTIYDGYFIDETNYTDDTLTGGNGNDIFFCWGGKDVITDYTENQDKIKFGSSMQLLSSASLNGSDVVLNIGNDGETLTIKNGKGKRLTILDYNDNVTNTIIGGVSSNSTLKTVTNSDSSPITVDSAVKSINASSRTTAIKITGNSIANTIQGGSAADTIYGGSGNDLILGNNGNDKLYGDAGTDTLNGGKGNDTLTGGAGADVFVYASSSGNDVIADYVAGTDKISITGAKISKSSVSGSDVILTVGSGSIRVKNGKGKSLSIYNNSTSAITTVIGSSSSSTTSTTLTVTNSTTSPVTVGSAVKNINASSRTTAVKITGNSLANSIIGGSGADSINGGSGSDTLNGGKGNDTLTGGAGNDVFLYQSGQGNDVITDYATGDKLKITGAKISKASVSGSNVVLTVGSGKVTLKGAKGKTLSIYNNSTTLTSTVIGGSSSSSTLKTITDSDSSPVTVDSAVKLINASSRTKAIKITGNTLANTIRGGSGVDTIYGGSGNDSILGNNGNDKLYGDAGADTLVGGKGNDTLTGGNGKDVFVYASGDGNDVITDYASSDKIKISGSYSTIESGEDVIIKVGSGQITVIDAIYEDLNITKSDDFMELDLDSILDSDSKLIGNDYNYDSTSILTKQLNQTLVTNSTKQPNK